MTHAADGSVDLVCMTTTQKQARSAEVPAQRKRTTAKAKSRVLASEPSRRYQLDTAIKDLTPADRAYRG